MNSSGLVVRNSEFENIRRRNERKMRIREKSNEIPEGYNGDIKRFLEYCLNTEQEVTTETLLDYLYVSLVDEKIKKNTWERRLAAVRRYLTVKEVGEFDSPEVKKELSIMREMYKEERFADLINTKGKSPVDKEELLRSIHTLEVRQKAICLVNLITANRPNEMVRLKIKDFDIDGLFVSVYMPKQKKWHNKRLTLDAAKSVREYIRKYNLKPEDYFVGRIYRNGRFESQSISESAYRRSLVKWLGLTGYNLRKTQVSSMHEAGADLNAIAKQTGHKSIRTIENHYLTVSDKTIDKYL